MVERELPEGWEWKRLGDVSIVSDRNHGTPIYEKSGYPLISPTMFKKTGIDFTSAKFVGQKEFDAFKKKCNPEFGDILYSRIGTIGKARLINFTQDFVALHSIALIKPKKGIIDPNFLEFLLNSKNVKEQAFRNVKSISVPDLGLGNIENFQIPLPPLHIQHQIVAVLEQAEAVKRQRQEADALTGALLQSVFLEMFGDPIRNERGWEIVCIGDIANHVSSGSTPRGGSDVYDTSGILFIRSQNIHMNKMICDNIAYISDEIHQSMQRSWVKSGDVLFNITGASIGRVAWYSGDDDSANVNQHVCIIRTDKRKILPEFLSYQLSLSTYQSKILANQSGATRQAFNYSQIKKFDIIIPPLILQQQFTCIVQEVERIREQQVESNSEINMLFEGLMTMAFSEMLVTNET